MTLDNDWLKQLYAQKDWSFTEYAMEPSINCPVSVVNADGSRHGVARNIKPVEAFMVLVAEGPDNNGNLRTIATAYERLRPGADKRREFASQVIFEAVQSIFE